MAKRASVLNFLPEELILEIVSRLSSKPLIRFRYVSKSWSDMISKLLLSRKTRLAVLYSDSSGSRDARLLVLDQVDDDKTEPRDASHLVLDEEEDEKGATTEDSIDLYAVLPCRHNPLTGPARILGSYGCLLLLVLKSKEIFLLNPSTLQRKKVLDSPIPINDFRTTAGFCYDSVLDDYKVIIIVSHLRPLAYVASFKTKTWKKILVQWHHDYWGASTGMVVDEKIHWVVHPAHGGFLPVCKIVAFHPAENSFVEMPIPEHPEFGDQRSPNMTILGVLDGCLALSSLNKCNNTTYIWAMKRYGVASSWTNLFNIPSMTYLTCDRRECRFLIRPLFFMKEGKFLLNLLFVPGKLVEYDMEKKSYMVIHLPDKKTKINDIITFEEGMSFPHDAYCWVSIYLYSETQTRKRKTK